MEHDHAPASGRWRGIANDLGDARFLPVVGVVVGQRDDVSAARRLGQRALDARRDRVAGCRVRRADEPRVVAGDADQDGLGEFDLRAAQPFRTGGHRSVGEGVVADFLTGLVDVAHEVGVAGGLAADHEERAGDALPAEHFEDLGGPLRIRTVVEGQRDPFAGIGLRRAQPVALRHEQRPRAVHRRAGAEVRGTLGAGADGVGAEALEGDQSGEEHEAGAEQPPVAGRVPQA